MPSRKVDIDLLKLVLQRNELDVRQVNQILMELNEEIERQEDEPKPPPVKKQFAMLASDPEGKLAGVELVGWVIQIPEEENPATALERIHQAAHDYNASPKGSRMPVRSVGEACEHVAAKFFKEHGCWVKTKEPVYLLRTDNRIPRDEAGADFPE